MLSRLLFTEALLAPPIAKRPLAHGTDSPSKHKKARVDFHGSTPKGNATQNDELGSVHEPDATHWKRHSSEPSSGKCCRCTFIRAKGELQREFPWASTRPVFMGGHWRLGCDVCAWMHSCATRENHSGRRGCRVRGSKFAKYQFVYSGPIWDVRLRLQAHAVEEGHRAAVSASRRCAKQVPSRMFTQPDVMDCPSAMGEVIRQPLAEEMSVPAEEIIAQATAEVQNDSCLLKGRVPQPEDWLDTWAESTEQIAFHKQARIIDKKRVLKWRNLRRIRRKQVRIMAEVRREDVRKQLRSAQFISLSMDDRKYQKIIRFRCDAPMEPFVHRGVLGVMDLAKSAVGDFEEDHALIGVRKLDEFLNKFCTPLSKNGLPLETDISLKEHIRQRVRTFAADGGSKERRALKLAAKLLFPNVVLLLRDAAHALRIAIKDPLHFDALFGEIWTSLFDERHALVPDIMNSKKWQDLLQHIQQVVLRIPCESRPLAVVLKHLRFAKQRFDSSADPVAKVAFMLLPIATMLAYMGSDKRHKLCDRNRAKMLLKKLDSKFALAIGVSADWGLVTQAFIRLFDKTSHDIAKTESEIQAFKKTMQILFDEGGVFSSRDTERNIRATKLPAIGGYFGKVGVTPMFVTQHIEKMLRQRVVFNCGDEQVLLWGPPDVSDVQEVAERLKFVTAHVIDRVDVEFEHLKPFSCFNVSTVREAFDCTDPRAARKFQQSLENKVVHLATELHVDGTTAVQEYRLVARLIVSLTSPGRPLATVTNSEVWRAMLRPNVRLSHLPQSSQMRAMNVLIRFFISIEDGECAVERDLGALSKISAAHMNGGNDLDDDLIILKSDEITRSDICGDELAVGSCCTQLGAKGRRWATMWRQIYGARLGCNRKATGRVGKRRGTYEAAKAGVLAAAEYAVAADMQHTEQEGDAITPLGVRKSFLKSAIGDKAEAYSNVKFKRFQALTQRKKVISQPFLRRTLSNKFQRDRAAIHAQKLENIKRICFSGGIGASLPHPVAMGCTEVCGSKRGVKADLAVVDDLSRLFECTDDDTVIQALGIVARGVPVITSASWVLAQGDPGMVPQASVVRHAPLVTTRKCIFLYDDHFRARCSNLLSTIVSLSELPNSKWKVRRVSAVGDSRVAASEGLCVKLSGVDVVRSWILEHRRIHNVLGSKVWSLTQPMY